MSIDVWAIKKEFGHLVVNLNAPDAEWDVVVDRSSKWGNPFHLRVDTPKNRQYLLIRFHANLQQLVRTGKIPMGQLAELAGKTLACHCSPKLCHGHILAWAAQKCDIYLRSD